MSSEKDTSITVLVAEDNPLALLTVRVCLEDMGCLVSEASSCREAVEHWESGRFDLVIMDYRLPDGLGTDVIREMREGGRNDPVICLTAETENISDEQRAKLGIRAALNKPLDLSALRNEIEKARGEVRPGAPVPAGGSQADKECRTIGKFTVFKFPGAPENGSLEDMECASGGEDWVAMDMKNVKHLNDIAISALTRIAERYADRGGRFCLAGVSAPLRRQLSDLRVDRKLDIFSDVQALGFLGRRLFSNMERSAVLESVIKGKVNT